LQKGRIECSKVGFEVYGDIFLPLNCGANDHHVTAVVPAFLIISFAGFSDSLPARHKFSEDIALINFADGDPDDLME
jgi:hypothetical protein